jgi:succinate-acetate transporter protein
MEIKESEVKIRRYIELNTGADPSSFGFTAFGLTIILFGFINAGFMDLDSVMMSMALFQGGISMMIFGVMAW